jgi:hypothetical protein
MQRVALLWHRMENFLTTEKGRRPSNGAYCRQAPCRLYVPRIGGFHGLIMSTFKYCFEHD